MDARRLAVELQLSAKRGTASGEQVNAVVDALLEMTDKLERLEAENAKLRELVRDYHTFLALAELAQPIGHVIAAHGHPTLSVDALDERYRELGVEVDG